MAWCLPCDKPLFEPMMVRLPTHICVTRPKWVNSQGRQEHPHFIWSKSWLLMTWCHLEPRHQQSRYWFNSSAIITGPAGEELKQEQVYLVLTWCWQMPSCVNFCSGWTQKFSLWKKIYPGQHVRHYGSVTLNEMHAACMGLWSAMTNVRTVIEEALKWLHF